MTEKSATEGRQTPLPTSLARTVRRARAITLLERLLVAITPFLAVLALILALALFGLWQAVPAPVAWLLTALAALALMASLWPFRALTVPTEHEARRRVEERSELQNRPVETLADTLTGGTAESARLWEMHRKRMALRAQNAKTGPVEPKIAALDPLALRAVPLLLLVIALAYAGGDWESRVTAMVAPTEAAAPVELARIDAWVTPPVYTGEPPVFLTKPTASAASATDEARAGLSSLTVPENSRLTVRISNADTALLSLERAGSEPELIAPRADPQSSAAGRFEYDLEIEENGLVTIEAGERVSQRWVFDVIPDEAPEIAFATTPGPAVSGALHLTYQLMDDYGVVGAEAGIVLHDPNAAEAGGARPLYEPPTVALVLPEARVRDGAGETFKDLLAHPWAGAAVEITLTARDEAGQTGTSGTEIITLPERRFREPLARALVEQRRALALDADRVVPVLTALDALSIAPEQFIEETTHYLLLRSAYWRLQNAKTDDQLREIVDYLWEIALVIEDGDLSLAERRLREAQENLMSALERDASDEELRQLMQELRQALNEFLQALAENADNLPEMADPSEMPDQSQMLSSQDLERMLDMIEDLAQTGARDAARQMLSQLQNMLENLQNARRMPQMQQGDSQMSEALQDLQDMIRRQQGLMDDTFQLDRQGQQGRQQPGQQGQQGQPGQRGQQGEGGYSDQIDQLGQGQQALREALESLMQQLNELGVNPGQALGEAGQAMRDAEGNLRGDELGQAVDDQGRALESLRQGTQNMMQDMMQGLAGAGENPGLDQRDPLGRPQRTEGPDLGTTVRVPDEIDVQRAREILKELRQRLSDPSRRKLESDYLERLITPY